MTSSAPGTLKKAQRKDLSRVVGGSFLALSPETPDPDEDPRLSPQLSRPPPPPRAASFREDPRDRRFEGEESSYHNVSTLREQIPKVGEYHNVRAVRRSGSSDALGDSRHSYVLTGFDEHGNMCFPEETKLERAASQHSMDLLSSGTVSQTSSPGGSPSPVDRAAWVSQNLIRAREAQEKAKEEQDRQARERRNEIMHRPAAAGGDTRVFGVGIDTVFARMGLESQSDLGYAPPAIQQVIAFLSAVGRRSLHIFVRPGGNCPPRVAELVATADRGEPLDFFEPRVDEHDAAAFLKLYLSNLPEGLMVRTRRVSSPTSFAAILK
jgi:hypothetical protein